MRSFYCYLLLVLMVFTCTACQPAEQSPTLTNTPFQPALDMVTLAPPDLTATFQAITPASPVNPTQTSTPTVTQPPPTLPETSFPSLSETPTIGACSFVWSRRGLAELSARLLVKLNDAQIPVKSASAEAYGEDCVYADGSVAYFAAMETDYRVTLSVTDLSDTATLGDLLVKTLTVIDQFPVGETPGPNPGYIGITFSADGQDQNLWFERRQADELRQQGLSGAELYQALKAH